MFTKEMLSTPPIIAAQCMGLVAMLLAFFVYAFRDRRKILLSKLILDLLWLVHYALLSAYSGAAVNGINAVREGVFYNKKKAWARHIAWPILFVCLNLATVVLAWQGWISILPALGSSLNAVALWSSSTRRLRLLTIPALGMWLVYSILVCSVWSLLVNAVSIVSALVGLIRNGTAAPKG